MTQRLRDLNLNVPSNFMKRGVEAAPIVAAVVSSQSISSCTGDSCSWRYTNHCHLQWVSFVHRSKKKNELEQTDLSVLKLKNQNGSCQHPFYRSTFPLLSLYDADPSCEPHRPA